MMITMTIWLPLPLPCSSYCHLTHSGASAQPQSLGLILFVDLQHFRNLKPSSLTLCLSLVPGSILLSYFVPKTLA